MTHLKCITKFLLTSSHLWSASIAILTSAIVALVSVSFNWLLLFSWLFFLGAIILLSSLLKITQLVQSKQFELLKTTSPEYIVNDAFRDSVELMRSLEESKVLTEKELDNTVKTEEGKVIAFFFIICVLILVGCALAWKGMDLRNKKQEAELVRVNTTVVDSVLSKYDSRNYETMIRLDERIILLSDSIQINRAKINEVSIGVENISRKIDELPSQLIIIHHDEK